MAKENGYVKIYLKSDSVSFRDENVKGGTFRLVRKNNQTN
jgi:hypothetical protein